MGDPEDYLVHFPETDHKVANQVGSLFKAHRLDLERKWGKNLPKPTEIFIAQSHAEFENILGKAMPSYVRGVTLPGENRIVLNMELIRKNFLANLNGVMAHEIFHLVIHEFEKGKNIRFPLWYNEGLACQNAPFEVFDSHQDYLMKLNQKDGLLDFSSLRQEFPANEGGATLAYIQSTHFVVWMSSKFGKDTHMKILRDFEQHGDFEKALSLATGQNFQTLERQWRGGLKDRFFSIAKIFQPGNLILAASFLVMFGVFLVWKRNRALKKKWHEEEAFWKSWD